MSIYFLPIIILNKFQSKNTISREIQIQDGFFEFKNDNNLDLSEHLPLLEKAALYHLKKVKSTIHAIQAYMNESNNNVQTHQKLLKKLEDEIIKLCENIDTDYFTVEIDENYSGWFKGYFLN